MPRRWLAMLMLGTLIGIPGCDGDDDDCAADSGEWVTYELEAEGSRLIYHRGGYLDIVDAAGHEILVHGVGALRLDDWGADAPRLTTDADRERTVEFSQGTTALGDSQQIHVTVEGEEGEPDLRWSIAAYRERGFYTFRLGVDNTTDNPIALAKAAPLETRWDADGGLFLGQAPSEHRILENGSYAALDFIAMVHPGDIEQDMGYANLAPGAWEGHSVSTGNHAVTDLGCDGDDAPGSCAWVAGALSFETSAPVIQISHNANIAPTSTDGRLGFHYFSGEAAWLPDPKPLAPGEYLDSEWFYVHPVAGDAAEGLEQYAEVTAAAIGTVPWHRREEGRRVPNGWNSWSGSGGTGGYGTGIGEAETLENLDVMATELRDWGIDWFQFDDGYEPYYGDWYDWVEEKFPSGPEGLSQAIRDRGFKPGLWMAPFTADLDSQLYAEHPDWFAEPVPLGVAVVGDQGILDLSHPEVHQYLDELFTTFVDEWGFEWLKLDFGYLAMFGHDFYEADYTREEAWRSSMEVIRAALGEETFFLIIGQLGINLGLADGGRLTLDTMPVWEHEPGQTMMIEEAGLKPSLRTFTRRWYFQDRTWVNHPDLFFFRSNTVDESWPRVTFTEARTFATAIALTGGIVKLGDRLVDLDGDAINVIRTMIPIYPTGARPLDVFEREFPEVYLQTIDAPLDGYGESYHLLGLFHWGENTDLTTNPYQEMAETGEDRVHSVDLEAQGLTGKYLAYEFWTGEFLGQKSGVFQAAVPAHDCRIVALRPPLEHPQFLGWNRQVSMGGTVLGEVSWDEDERQLTLEMDAALPSEKAPFTYEIAIHVPDGYTHATTASTGVPLADVTPEQDGEVLRIRFVPEATGPLTLMLGF